MWDPLDQYAPNNPLLRGVLAGLFWLGGVTGAVVIASAPVAGLFIGPFVILALVFSAQLALSAYRGGGEPSGSSDGDTLSREDVVEDAADSALAVLRERYARGEIDHDEFESRVNRLLDTEGILDGDDRDVALERE